MNGYVCCRVCGRVFELDGAIAGTGLGFEQVPTKTRGDMIVCRPSGDSDCRRRLEVEINRLVREENYQGLITFYKPTRGAIHE